MVKYIRYGALIILIGIIARPTNCMSRKAVGFACLAGVASVCALYWYRLHSRNASATQENSIRHDFVLPPATMPDIGVIEQAEKFQSESPLVQMPREIIWRIASFLRADAQGEAHDYSTVRPGYSFVERGSDTYKLPDVRSINNLFSTCKALHWKPFLNGAGDYIPYIKISCRHEELETYKNFITRFRRMGDRLDRIARCWSGNREIHINISRVRPQYSMLDRHNRRQPVGERFPGVQAVIERLSRLPIMPLITEINISNNFDQDIPSCIGSFVGLKRLSVAWNMIKTLPPTIGNLTKLEQLDVMGNQIEEFPLELKQLINLKKINLAGCRDKKASPRLFEIIGNLSNLEECNLRCCELESIPVEQMQQLRRLTNLDLRENTIPKEQIALLRRDGLTIWQ